jgi:hypothetical protein
MVVDTVTGKPIEGAVVCMQWKTRGVMMMGAGRSGAFYETKTDATGNYYIPTQRLERSLWYEGIHHEDVLIYKDRYSGYTVSGTDYRPVGRSFASGAEDQPYRKRRNHVRLFSFKQSDSHYDHLRWLETPIGIFGWPEQMKKELQNEMERERKELKND